MHIKYEKEIYLVGDKVNCFSYEINNSFFSDDCPLRVSDHDSIL